MKLVWTLLTLLFAGLAITGVVTAAERTDTASVVGDLVISAFLGLGAWACWRRVAAAREPRPDSLDGPDRPWER
ncbi:MULTISPECIES: hypothetical protein [unclassified Streptomyces]|uniref:hypothetical protein n=1 Tax=unclassified Streptomyces TaxID=2593676 RepID=UPI001487FEF8|nr:MULTISPECIES: hypothetical protein [unclassified Streptomyces]